MLSENVKSVKLKPSIRRKRKKLIQELKTIISVSNSNLEFRTDRRELVFPRILDATDDFKEVSAHRFNTYMERWKKSYAMYTIILQLYKVGWWKLIQNGAYDINLRGGPGTCGDTGFGLGRVMNDGYYLKLKRRIEHAEAIRAKHNA